MSFEPEHGGFASESPWRGGMRREIRVRQEELRRRFGACFPEPVFTDDTSFSDIHDRLGALHKTLRQQAAVTDWARCRAVASKEADGRYAYTYMDGVRFRATCGPDEDPDAWLALFHAQAAERGAEIETRGNILYIVWSA